MKRRSWLGLTLLLTGSFLLSCLCGRYPLTAGDLWEIVSGQAAGTMKETIFWNIRMARTCVTGLCGAALSLLLARAIGGKRYFNLIICGIILGALANAAIMALKYMADPTHQLAVIDYWLMGSFHLASWDQLRAIAPLFLAAGTVLVLLRYRLKVLTLGDEDAASLGVRVVPVRLACVASATVLVAASVSVSGIVSWVGLIVPHLVRSVLGDRFEANFFQSAVCGAALLLAADTLARSLLPSEIPISILTSLIGAVFLALFLFLRRERRWERLC